MEVITTVKDMQTLSAELRRDRRIGFIPTMGFLHEGHLSLVDRARTLSDVVVVSIFVNKKQFGLSGDFDSYPRDPQRDRKLLEDRNADYLFYPSSDEIYPPGYSTYVEVEGIDDTLCGRKRPGHMRAVATICMKLFNIVRPHTSVFGEKDYQQAVMIRKMVREMNMDMDVVFSPTVREEDGLAVSSRNIYLTEEERRDAPVLHKALLEGKRIIEEGEENPEVVMKLLRRMIGEKKTARVEYIETVDAQDLRILERIDRPALIALAVYFGKARLIDNILASPPGYIR